MKSVERIEKSENGRERREREVAEPEMRERGENEKKRRSCCCEVLFCFVSALYDVTFVFVYLFDNIMLRDVSICVRVYG